MKCAAFWARCLLFVFSVMFIVPLLLLLLLILLSVLQVCWPSSRRN
jgi:hypothetical protein